MKDEDKSLPVRLASIFRGYRTTEYALLIAFIGILVLIGITWFGVHLYDLYTNINNSVPKQ